jgi:hypothetical protein
MRTLRALGRCGRWPRSRSGSNTPVPRAEEGNSLTSQHDGDAPRHEQRSPEQAGGKKPYVAPELVEYGTVAKLTQAGGGSVVDFGGMMQMGTCL